MAWNQPGGGDNKDPWGGKDQGPPDLDDALRKFQEKFSGIFGGKSTGSPGKANIPGGNSSLFMFVGVIALGIWAALGVYQVDQQERGVVLRFGLYNSTVTPGLHWNPPLIDKVYKVNVTQVRSATHRGEMLTEDQNIVDVALSVQYTVADPKNFLLKVRSPELSLEQALESALRHVVGSSEMDQVITEGREQIAVDVQTRLQNYLDSYEAGMLIAKINIQDARAPSQVQDAFDDVTRAKEDKERLKNEAEAYSNSIIPEARGFAQRQIEEANAYKEEIIAQAEGEAERFNKLLVEYKRAPEVTRERLYLETVQAVFSNTTKVMVDVDGGNNLLYLPLDKIVSSSRPSSSGAATNNQDIREITDRVLEQIRRDSQSRRRESR